MKKDIAEKWVAALRSNKFKKGTGLLHREDNSMCCLGVLCKINGIKSKPHNNHFKYEGSSAYLNTSLMKKFGMKSNKGIILDSHLDLTDLNDSNEYTFDEIADIIQICYKEL